LLAATDVEHRRNCEIAARADPVDPDGPLATIAAGLEFGIGDLTPAETTTLLAWEDDQQLRRRRFARALLDDRLPQARTLLTEMLLQRESALERWDLGGDETELQARLALATGDFPTFVAATAMRVEDVEVGRGLVAWAADTSQPLGRTPTPSRSERPGPNSSADRSPRRTRDGLRSPPRRRTVSAPT
jgi:hypothetical protein